MFFLIKSLKLGHSTALRISAAFIVFEPLEILLSAVSSPSFYTDDFGTFFLFMLVVITNKHTFGFCVFLMYTFVCPFVRNWGAAPRFRNICAVPISHPEIYMSDDGAK